MIVQALHGYWLLIGLCLLIGACFGPLFFRSVVRLISFFIRPNYLVYVGSLQKGGLKDAPNKKPHSAGSQNKRS